MIESSVAAQPPIMGDRLHQILGVPSGVVAEIWPGVRDLVARAAAKWPGDRSADDYLAACRCADAQLWLVSRAGELRAAVITQVLNFPQHRVAIVELMAGQGMDDWVADLDEALTRWAVAEGCARLRTGGRRGLTKAAQRLGYDCVAVVLEKDLSDAGR